MQTNFNIIVAVDEKGGIARNSTIPWYFSEDFKHFRDMTMGKACVMGVNTYYEINNKLNNPTSVLPGRPCYVISTTLDSLPNAVVVRALDEIPESEVFIIGGEYLYDVGLNFADTVYITRIAGDFNCNKFFPVDKLTNNFQLMAVKDGNDPSLTFELWFKPL